MSGRSSISFDSVLANGSRIKTLSALTGEPIAEIPQSTPEDVAAAYERARGVQGEWAAVPVAARARILLRFHDLLLARQDEVLDLIQTESGKVRWHAYQEVISTAMNARYYGLRAASLLRTRRRAGMLPVLTHVLERRCPVGVVGVISAWNYPLDLGLSEVMPALVAGNGAVHKPDNQGALTALWGRDLLREAGLPEHLYQLVLGDGPTVGGAVVEGADHICFTGSTRVGRLISERAGTRMVGASLELGGKNPLLVLDDADPVVAATGAARDCFTSAGQMCGSSERILVHAKVYDRFVAELVARVRALRVGVGLDYESDMGSLVSQRQFDTVRAHLDDAVAKGATVLTGGRARPEIGPFVLEPTVLTGVTEDMTCFAEETFGPVVWVRRCESVDEAVRLANDSSYGLNACVWGRDTRRAREVAARLRCGTVNINEIFGITYGSVDTPMGGMKDSGLGRRHGREGLLRFTEAQSVATQRGMRLEPPFGIGYGTLARGYTAAMRAMRLLRRR